MNTFFALIRTSNLIYIFITLCALRFLLIDPLFVMAGYTPSLHTVGFLLLILSVMLIAAAGYIINDYFDIEADRINKPEKAIIGKAISPDKAMLYYHVCNSAGIILGGVLAWQVGNIRLIFVHLITAALLWFYATSLKRKPFIGNLIISALVALSIFCVALFDLELLTYTGIKIKVIFKSLFESVTGFLVTAPELNNYTNRELLDTILTYVAGYAGFAFILNLIRELAKVMEDLEGDEEAGYRTLPLVAGVAFTKLLAAGLTLITVNFIAKFQISQMLAGQIPVAIATLILIQLPLIYITYKLYKASQKHDFSHISKIVKLVMLAGLLYLPYLRAGMQFIPPQTTLPPGIESITFEPDTTNTLTVDTAEANLPDTIKYIIDSKTGLTHPDTASVPVEPKKNTLKTIGDDLLK